MKLSEESASTSIYLEQIDNHINLGEGYGSVRQLLFKELNLLDGTNPSADDRLAESIVDKLTESLSITVNFHQSQKTYRALQVITDLLTYAEEIMTPAMHNEQFVASLNSVALPKIVTFNSSLDTQCRNIALGIISFWYDKYAREQSCSYDLYIQAFKYLKEKKLAIPQKIIIKPVDTYKPKNATSNSNGPSQNTTMIILQQIEQFTVKTQKLLKENIKNIATTEYVRLIKHKSKVLFDFTQKGGDLNQKQKGTVKDCYKRLRAILKEVDKYNQNKVETKVSMNQEQEYVEQKMTPKKSEKSIEPKSNEKKSLKKQELKKQLSVDLLGESTQTAKAQEKPKENSKQFDLLDIGLASEPKSQTPQITVIKTQNSVDFVDLLGQNTPQTTKVSSPQQAQDEQQQFVEGVLVDTNYQKSLQKEKSDRQLQEVFSTPSKKQVSLGEETDALAKQGSNQSQHSNPDFHNEKKKDKYSELHEIDLSYNSSDSQRQTPQKNEGLRFNLFGIFGSKQYKIEGEGALYDENRPYDYIPQALQKKTISSPETISQALATQQTSLPLMMNSMQFKPVKAVDYSKYAHQTSPQSDKDIDEDHAFEPNKTFHDLEQAQVEAPRKASKKGDLLGEEDD